MVRGGASQQRLGLFDTRLGKGAAISRKTVDRGVQIVRVIGQRLF